MAAVKYFLNPWLSRGGMTAVWLFNRSLNHFYGPVVAVTPPDGNAPSLGGAGRQSVSARP
jgi:hypothetical protein